MVSPTKQVIFPYTHLLYPPIKSLSSVLMSAKVCCQLLLPEPANILVS